ncbi:energy-converting hydrogenase B subunit J [Methanobrevibacter curvatus]|uniref:Energy-converting hydrogenase B subunit J n=1 Tax=Methanobrevibacter curvatus TaxID=49547 RepID=A0A166C596_9EURY|nr:energy-converting hydrogenase B subunit J [Methanobrevibacter curvatus]KZX14142.1 hypothetical protein MBCUR_06180 [Methanobrevibacter curvatus]
MINFGPIFFGFIIGLLVGLSMKNNPKTEISLTSGSFVVITIVAIVCAWQLGPFPYYTDFPIATGFLFGAIGLIFGKLLVSKA